MSGEIFISYRRADRAWAELLHGRLQAEGVEAWYDAHVGAGQDWRIATATALKASRIFVLLFSKSAAQSGDIAKELAAAVFEKKLIIPVRLENIAPEGAFLYELASRNWVNAYEDTETRLGELAKGLAQMVRTGIRDESLLPFERTEGSKPRRAKRLVIVAAAAIAATAAATWLLWPQAHWTVESSRPFLSSLVPEDDPAFSPDGKTLAYTAGNPGSRKIYIRNLAGGDGLKVSDDAYDDVSPTWSSDGGRIAYIAEKSGEPCRIMVVSVPAGRPREAGRCGKSEFSTVTWQPGTPFLYFTDRINPFASAIFRFNLDSGERAAISARRNSDYFNSLNCSPDGKYLVYLKYGTTTDPIVIRDLASGKETVLGRVAKSVSTQWPVSAAWSEDSRTVLVTASGGNEIMAYPANASAPYRVYATANAAGHIAVGSGGRLAIETDASRINLARAASAPTAQPDIIDAANGLSLSPSFAPDGTLAFLSNRSGSNAVWVKKPGGAPALLFDGGFAPLFLAEFSPDGSRLLVVHGSQEGVTYRILTAEGASVATFTTPDLAHGVPTWTADGKGVITGGHYASRVAVDNPTQTKPFAPAPWEAVAVHDGHTYAARHDRPNTLWRIDTAPALVSSKYDDHRWPPMTFQGDNVLIPDFDGGGARILAQPLAGGPDRIAAYAPGLQDKGYLGKLAVNPKTGEIVYAASVAHDTNIDLLTLARH